MARGVDHDWYGVGVYGCNPTNVADKAAVAHVRTGTDSNNAIGRGNVAAGTVAQGRVEASGAVAKQREITVGRVHAAGGVVEQRSITVGRVEGASHVTRERLITIRRVGVAGGVAK